MKTVKVIECEGKVEHDPTSYGYQYSVHLKTDEFTDVKELREKMNQTVQVRIEIVVSD